MYIEEIVIDGFKSYQSRTVISQFDPNFNAITGLNGSGKSNILDAICFVLGITNYSQLRVNGLQELVYKQGQAGIRKASVSIVFNNQDKSNSPIGYEQHDQIIVTRQIVIGGKSKFLINGHTAQANRVQSFFHSVQLNIQNPHFLIMQGHIAKVLNMKPMEILSMLEEASGTRLFETNKAKALKTIAKKQLKVEEINKVLEEKIRPTLKSLRLESQQYGQFLKSKSIIDKMTKFCIAYDYYTTFTRLSNFNDEQDALASELQEVIKNISNVDNMIVEVESLIDNAMKKKGSGMNKEISKLESSVGQKSKELAELNANYQNNQDTLNQLIESLNKINTDEKDLLEELESKKLSLESAEAELEKATKEKESLSAKLSAIQQGYSSADDGGAKTAQAQLMDARRKIASLETDRKTLTMKKEHLESKLKNLKQERPDKSAYDKLIKEKENIMKELDILKSKLTIPSDSNINDKTIRKDIEKWETELRKIQKMAEPLARRFNYKIPEGVNRAKVYGMVCKLIEVLDEKAELALDIAGSSKLFNIVLEDVETGNSVISAHQRQGLNRITCIPLDKINPNVTKEEKISFANQIGKKLKKEVNHALNLISFDKKYAKAIEHVFGNVIICEDEESAQKVTFSKEVLTPSVTLKGSMYSPEGTLNGGSAPKSGEILKNVKLLRSYEMEMDSLKKKIKESQELLNNIQKDYKILQEIELKQHELSIHEQRISKTPYYIHQSKKESTEQELSQIEEDLVNNMNSLQEMNSLLEKYEKEVSKGSKSGVSIKEIKSQLDNATKLYSSAHKNVVKLRAEIEEMEKDIEEIRAQKEEIQQSLEQAEKVVEKSKLKYEEKSEEFEKLKKEYEEKRSLLVAYDGEIATYKKRQEELEKSKADLALKRKELKHRETEFKEDKRKLKKKIEHLEEAHSWINVEKQFFNKPGSDYDFESKDIKKVTEELKKLEEDHFRLSKTINSKASNMLVKTEQECKELLEKQTRIKNDKEKIESVIRELDQKKIETLNHTYEKVNQEFGAIFSELLPGAKAKLEFEGKDIMDGLRVKVAFGEDWKESLSELSGGQKSLLALSLILALLKFKPAPMYILDEIDAALDLSHTQNIGQVLKKKFSQSQFIVVSLKEGMFNNANVLFKTRFSDGVSHVDRFGKNDIRN